MGDINEMPKGWQLVKLSEVTSDLQSGKRPKGGVQGIETGIPSLGGEHLNDVGSFKFDKIKYVPIEFAKKMNKGVIQIRDIIIVKDGATTGKTSFVKETFPFKVAVINEHVFILRLHKEVLSEFAFYRIWSQKGKNEILEDFRGAAQGGISSSFTNYVNIPLPPLPEQHRIVAKIEELFSSLDKGIESLKTAQQQLKVYRQAVLKWAFEGKLTEEWRKQQKDLPSASQLLEQIKNAREKQAKVTGKKLKPIESLTEAELAELSKLPGGWIWVKLGEITHSVKDGPHYSPPYQTKGIPFITGGNIKPEGVDFKNVKYISEELNNELNKRCKPEIGDILYTKGGTTGIARVNSYDFEFNVWVHVAVLKIVDYIAPFYLQNALNSHHCYKQSQKYTHGVGNQDLGLTRMVNITLPICSSAEQNQIVSEIESRLSVCDKIEESIEQSLKQSEALRQSILKKAFEGKLVRQDPNDEPASGLLDRIKAEREKNKSENLLRRQAGKTKKVKS